MFVTAVACFVLLGGFGRLLRVLAGVARAFVVFGGPGRFSRVAGECLLQVCGFGGLDGKVCGFSVGLSHCCVVFL